MKTISKLRISVQNMRSWIEFIYKTQKGKK